MLRSTYSGAVFLSMDQIWVRTDPVYTLYGLVFWAGNLIINSSLNLIKYVSIFLSEHGTNIDSVRYPLTYTLYSFSADVSKDNQRRLHQVNLTLTELPSENIALQCRHALNIFEVVVKDKLVQLGISWPISVATLFLQKLEPYSTLLLYPTISRYMLVLQGFLNPKYLNDWANYWHQDNHIYHNLEEVNPRHTTVLTEFCINL